MKEARENEKSQSVGKVRLIKRRNLPKEEGRLRMGVLEPQKSQECCRRKEGSGRILIKGQENRRKRRKVLQKGWRIEKKEREG